MTPALVAVAGAAGALARWAVGERWGGGPFPWARLWINLVGSLALGVLVKLAVDWGWSEVRTVPLTVGFLGAFTTFSTFSNETQQLLRDGWAAAAGGYVAASVVGGVAAAALGYALAAAST